MPPNVARRHHTVPAFYLSSFAKSGQIQVVQLPGTRQFMQSVNRVSVHNDFYSVPGHEDGSDVLERNLSSIEGQAAQVVAAVHRGIWPLPEAERTTLGSFIALQSLRGPDQRRHMEQLMAHMTRLEIGYGGRRNIAAWVKKNKGVDVSPELADRLWKQAIAPGGPPIRLSAAGHMRQVADMLPKIIHYFLGRPWVLINFDRRSLITSDAPVAVVPHAQLGDDGTEYYETEGFANAWGISFPIGRKQGLLMASPEPLFGNVSIDDVASGAFDAVQAPSARYARMLNGITVRNARSQLYLHPDDIDELPKKLPDPVEDEVVVSGNPSFSTEGDEAGPSEFS